jgi:N-hydroxyarylamine O-acetyltransferase
MAAPMDKTLSTLLDSPTTFDASAYQARLGIEPPQDCALGTLAQVLLAHMRSIPFENLDVLLGRPPRLDLPSLQDKLVVRRRGGYCFEHSALLGAALRYYGFVVRDHLARVVVERPREQAGRTHHFLVVSLTSGPVIVDAGFGGLAPQVPVPLIDGARVRAGGVTHHLRRDGGWWTLSAQAPDLGGERVLWTSALEECYAPDFEMGNHFTATHASSPFRHRLAMRALIDGGRVSVLNREVTLRQGRVVQRWSLRHRAALHALLRRHFGIELPEVEQLIVPAIPGWE